MNYHAMQAIFRSGIQRLQYQVAYTFSSCMTNNDGYSGNWGAQASPPTRTTRTCTIRKADWRLLLRHKHVLSGYAVYEIPFGRGKKYATIPIGQWMRLPAAG